MGKAESGKADIRSAAECFRFFAFSLSAFLLFSFLSVDLFRRFELGFGDLKVRALVLNRAEETGLITFVAGRADLFHFNQQRVAVAIKRDVFHGLRMAAALALHPEFLTRPAPKMRLASINGFFE